MDMARLVLLSVCLVLMFWRPGHAAGIGFAAGDAPAVTQAAPPPLPIAVAADSFALLPRTTLPVWPRDSVFQVRIASRVSPRGRLVYCAPCPSCRKAVTLCLVATAAPPG